MSGKPIPEEAVAQVCDRILTAAIGKDWRKRAPEAVTAFWMGEVREALQEVVPALTAAQQQGQAVAECHCATCTCAPGMTPAVRFDTSPAAQEGAVRDHLITLGWTPPGAQQPAPSAPVGVEDGPIDASDNAEYIEHCADRLERCGLPVTAGALRVIAHEHRTLAQQPAAVDDVLTAAMEEGFTFQKPLPAPYLTDEANERRAWVVERSRPPFCDDSGVSVWVGPTPQEALSRARRALAAQQGGDHA